jgi:hypothetical protein
MKAINSILPILAITSFMALFSSCKKDDAVTTTIKANTINNLAADPPKNGFDPNTGQALGVTRKFTLFNFKTGSSVSNADSASTKWDIGFNATSIIVNGGTSGPGQGAGQVVSGIFSDITTAPDAGFVQDNKSATPTAVYAIPRGSGNGWYSISAAMVVTPIAGRVLIFKTADGKYAKVEILSYYQNAPTAPAQTDPSRYYTFRYVYQDDGSNKLN